MSWLATLEHTLATLHPQAGPDVLAATSQTLATLTAQFDALPEPEKTALLPHLALVQTRLDMLAASLRAEQSALRAQLTGLRTRSAALGAYKTPGEVK